MKDLLRMGALFAPLSDDEIDRLAKLAVRVRLDKGQALFEQGDPADRFYLVIEGRIKLFRLSPSGSEKIIEAVGPGGTFGEALVFLKAARFPVGAQALVPSVALSIDSADFSSMMWNSPATCFSLMADMSQRLRALVREVDELSQYSAACRLAAYIHNHLEPGKDELVLGITKQDLASRLSIKPETFSRILKDMCKRGLISVDGPVIHAQDKAGLQTMAETCMLGEDSLEGSFHPSSNR
ncbi:MAG: Crp/Fnr family transcriptional regulator [Gammaproteobacteria bacterium]